MTPKVTLRASLKVANTIAIDLSHHHLSALLMGLYDDETHKQRLLSGLGLAMAVRDQLELCVPPLDYIRSQCRPQKHLPAAYSRILAALRSGGEGIPAVLRDFFRDLSTYARAYPYSRAVEPLAVERLAALPDLLDQAKELAENSGDMALIKSLLD